jgi:stage II sporulation protein D
VTYGGKPAITYFFASSGGMTENIENSFLGSQPQPWLKGVPDSYEAHSSWKLSMTFAAAAARLQGLLKGSFKGIEVLKRGVSPRIVAAEVLGSRGATPVSGPELAGRLGLSSTWTYFTVKSGAHVKREPDHSGQPVFTPSAPENPPPAAPAPVPGPGGGTQLPATASATTSATGGASAG